jgi:thiosulfate/3-mercaptopyruvate sulfurtransferase
MHSNLISVQELQQALAQKQPLLLIDCSFDLAQPAAGGDQYAQAHIPGALHADLDLHLSAHDPAAAKASGGRHPLPAREHFAAWLAAIGLNQNMQVVTYDRSNHSYAARLWWMLQWAGHGAAAVLDGGLAAWQAQGGATEAGAAPTPRPGNFVLRAPLRRLLTVDEVQKALGHPEQTLIDARATPRFKGEVEPLDPVAGHIPGALNRPFTDNLTPEGHFKPAAALRQDFDALLAGRARHRGAPLRQRRHRPAQSAGHGAGRPGSDRPVCRQLERMVQRPEPTDGPRLRKQPHINFSIPENRPPRPVFLPSMCSSQTPMKTPAALRPMSEKPDKAGSETRQIAHPLPDLIFFNGIFTIHFNGSRNPA